MMRQKLLLPVVVLCLLAVGCGSDSSETAPVGVRAPEPTVTTAPAAPTATPEPEREPTVNPAPTTEPETETETAEMAEAPATPTTDEVVETYDVPGDLELRLPLAAGEPGEVIDTEVLEIDRVEGLRLLYHSTSASGDDIAVSGFVAYPTGDAPEGGWPLIAWAHGTTGLGDTCAPSINAETDALAAALVAFGYAVVATDYEGLGTPGVHPYVVGNSEAYGVLDSVRAVQALGLPVTDQWIAFGHSQGGHAAMFTGQLQPSYAPELDMIGVVAGAPPSQMQALGDSLVGGDFQGYMVMTAAGLAAADDSLNLGDVFSEEAIDLLDVVETGCTAEIFDVYNPLNYDDVSIVPDPFALPDWGQAIEANDTNQLPVLTPLLIIHGGEDEQIPVETSAVLFDQLCAFSEQGPTVRNVYEGQTHAGVLTTGVAIPDLLGWVQGRFAGDPAPNNCPT